MQPEKALDQKKPKKKEEKKKEALQPEKALDQKKPKITFEEYHRRFYDSNFDDDDVKYTDFFNYDGCFAFDKEDSPEEDSPEEDSPEEDSPEDSSFAFDEEDSPKDRLPVDPDKYPDKYWLTMDPDKYGRIWLKSRQSKEFNEILNKVRVTKKTIDNLLTKDLFDDIPQVRADRRSFFKLLRSEIDRWLTCNIYKQSLRQLKQYCIDELDQDWIKIYRRFVRTDKTHPGLQVNKICKRDKRGRTVEIRTHCYRNLFKVLRFTKTGKPRPLAKLRFTKTGKPRPLAELRVIDKTVEVKRYHYRDVSKILWRKLHKGIIPLPKKAYILLQKYGEYAIVPPHQHDPEPPDDLLVDDEVHLLCAELYGEPYKLNCKIKLLQHLQENKWKEFWESEKIMWDAFRNEAENIDWDQVSKDVGKSKSIDIQKNKWNTFWKYQHHFYYLLEKQRFFDYNPNHYVRMDEKRFNKISKAHSEVFEKISKQISNEIREELEDIDSFEAHELADTKSIWKWLKSYNIPLNFRGIPKNGFYNYPLKDSEVQGLCVPVKFDKDVNPDIDDFYEDIDGDFYEIIDGDTGGDTHEDPVGNPDALGENVDPKLTTGITNNPEMRDNLHMNASRKPTKTPDNGSDDINNIN